MIEGGRIEFELSECLFLEIYADTPHQKSIRALEIFRVQKLILNATS